MEIGKRHTTPCLMHIEVEASLQYCFWPKILKHILWSISFHKRKTLAHKNTSNLSGCYRQSKQIESSWKYYRTSWAWINIIKKIDNWTQLVRNKFLCRKKYTHLKISKALKDSHIVALTVCVIWKSLNEFLLSKPHTPP